MIRDRKGFTLIELLVVIAIIAILAAILFPIFAAARAKARASSCMSGMNQIAKAILSYTGDYDDKFPCTRAPRTPTATNNPTTNRDLRPNVGAQVWQQGATWVERIDSYVTKGSIVNYQMGIMAGVFNCGEREKKWAQGQTTFRDYHSYGYNFLYLGLPWPRALSVNPYQPWNFINGATRVSRLENSSETIMLVESRSIWVFPPFANPPVNSYNNGPVATNAIIDTQTAISPRHGDKVNVAFCDGHVSAVDARELVGRGQPMKLANTNGTATSNKLWDTIKAGKYFP